MGAAEVAAAAAASLWGMVAGCPHAPWDHPNLTVQYGAVSSLWGMVAGCPVRPCPQIQPQILGTIYTDPFFKTRVFALKTPFFDPFLPNGIKWASLLLVRVYLKTVKKTEQL